MPNRFQINQHDIVYRFLVARDGERCFHPSCNMKPPEVVLQIDHADNDITNWAPEYLHLFCPKHNLELRHKTTAEHLRLIREYSAKNERERGIRSTNIVKEMVEFQNGSTEMKANSYFEINYRDWIYTTVKEQRFITKTDALNAGAEVVGCSTLTASRYLAKLTSSVSNLKETKDAAGRIVITFR